MTLDESTSQRDSATPTKPTDLELNCPACDYNLTGAPGHRCPWCGWRIDLEVLMAMAGCTPGLRRIATILVTAVFSIGSLLLVGGSLGRSLAPLVWVAVLGLLSAAVGHLMLGILAVRSRRRWPIHHADCRAQIGKAGWLAVLAGTIGAISLADAGPVTGRGGIAVNSTLEFLLAAMLYTFPGWILLVLRYTCFHDERPFKKDAERPSSGETPCSGAAPYVIEVVDAYPTAQITQAVIGTPGPSHPRIQALIEQTWQAQLAIAGVDGKVLYDGPLARLISFDATADSLHLNLGATCYRDFVGTNMCNLKTVRSIGDEYLADPLGISAMVITSDGMLALGRRSDHVAYHSGYLHTFGGMLEEADLRENGTYDIPGSAVRELAEELSIRAGEITELCVTGLVRDLKLIQPELLFDVKVALTHLELLDRFAGLPPNGEHTAIEFVADDPEAVLSFIERSRPVTPVAEAAILFHGRAIWGDDWYEGACSALYGRGLSRESSLPIATVRS